MFLLLLFIISGSFAHNQLTPKYHNALPFIFFNFLEFDYNLPLQFNQINLERIQSHFLLTNQSEDEKNKTKLALQGFIAYGQEREFTPKTILGHLKEESQSGAPVFIWARDPKAESPERKDFHDKNDQSPKLTDTCPFSLKIQMILDPTQFELPENTDLKISIENFYQKIHITPAMKTVIKQMIERGKLINS